MKRTHTQRGFTLIEMLVSLGLFAVVVLICTAALLALVGVNKKAQAIQSVMNDLNITIDSMVRNLREGTVYNCGATTAATADCPAGNTSLISFAPYGSDPTNQSQRWVYKFQQPCGTSAGCILRSKDGGATYATTTSPDVSLSSVTFYVVGTNNSVGDNYQPRVIIVIKGASGVSNDVKINTQFHIEASATQRQLDL